MRGEEEGGRVARGLVGLGEARERAGHARLLHEMPYEAGAPGSGSGSGR